MILEQYYISCLSQGSYLIGDETGGQAVVVDPRRDVDDYLDDAERHGLTIVGVINTHFHADFVAGHLELAARTGAWIAYGRRAEAEYEIRRLAHGERIALGEVEIEVLETPGHTWESISLLVREHAGDTTPAAVLTGDALFVGDVGRPDLAVSLGASADELARALYSSVHDVLMTLPDDVRLLPGHGAGSACGKNLSDELQSTIGAQRATNPSVQPMSEDTFVAMITAGQPSAPAYFAVDAVLNRQLRRTVTEPHRSVPLPPEDVRAAIDAGVRVLDTRCPDDFAAGHLRGAVNVGADGRLSETTGMVLEHEEPIITVTDAGREDEVMMRLARIGFDDVRGHVADPPRSFVELADLIEVGARIGVDELAAAREAGAVTVLDVRNPGEVADGAIEGSLHIPLAELVRRHGEVPADRPVVVQCASGWRSSVGASALRALGHGDVSDLRDGYDDWVRAHAPVTR